MLFEITWQHSVKLSMNFLVSSLFKCVLKDDIYNCSNEKACDKITFSHQFSQICSIYEG